MIGETNIGMFKTILQFLLFVCVCLGMHLEIRAQLCQVNSLLTPFCGFLPTQRDLRLDLTFLFSFTTEAIKVQKY